MLVLSLARRFAGTMPAVLLALAVISAPSRSEALSRADLGFHDLADSLGRAVIALVDHLPAPDPSMIGSRQTGVESVFWLRMQLSAAKTDHITALLLADEHCAPNGFDCGSLTPDRARRVAEAHLAVRERSKEIPDQMIAIAEIVVTSIVAALHLMVIWPERPAGSLQMPRAEPPLSGGHRPEAKYESAPRPPCAERRHKAARPKKAQLRVPAGRLCPGGRRVPKKNPR